MRFFFICCVMLSALVSPITAHAADEAVLCPDIDVMKRSAPGDISGVQADIERLNLCVERARLLKQLDDVVVQRQKTLDKLVNPNAAPTGNITTGLGMPTGMANGGIQPLPISSLPPLKGDKAPPKDLKPGEVRVTGAVGNAFDAAASVPKESTPDWQIRKIWGQGVGMRAQISDKASGTILNVVKGDPLPDGGTVETISVKGVAVSRNGNINDLSWEQLAEGSSSQNAKVIP